MDKIMDIISQYWNDLLDLVVDHGIISSLVGIGFVFCMIYVIIDGDKN